MNRIRLFARAAVVSVVVGLTAGPASGLMIPPDPFDATDRYALLSMAPDGSITQVWAKVAVPGPGELVAHIRYKLPPGTSSQGDKRAYYAVSRPVPIHEENPAAVIMAFDFSLEPLPPQASHRTMEIFHAVPTAAADILPNGCCSDSAVQQSRPSWRPLARRSAATGYWGP
jgi:hypothetical protein